jgi:hypothetical protein
MERSRKGGWAPEKERANMGTIPSVDEQKNGGSGQKVGVPAASKQRNKVGFPGR